MIEVQFRGFERPHVFADPDEILHRSPRVAVLRKDAKTLVELNWDNVLYARSIEEVAE